MEHEITGHTRKIYRTWKAPGVPFWKKVRETAIEILIIVFAVSLAAFLERQREESHAQAEVKEFLKGLKTDLQHDITEMQEDKITFMKTSKAFGYLYNVKAGELPNGDSVDKYANELLNTTGLVPNSGRYEGFKSSGKITNIKDQELQNDILDLYQETIPMLLNSTNGYTQVKYNLFNYFYDNIKTDANGKNNSLQVLSTDKVKNLSRALKSTNEIIQRYDAVIEKSKKIIQEIDAYEK